MKNNILVDDIGYILYYKIKGGGLKPVISRFYGIIIKMYFRHKEHNPPHIHAIYGECVGVFGVQDGEMIEGDIPLKEQQKIKKFILFHRKRLLQMWEKQDFEMLSPVE